MPLGKLILRGFKGVNLSQSRRLIADEELLWSRNVYPNERGYLETRPRMKEILSLWNLMPSNYHVSDGYTLGNMGEPFCKFFEFVDENGKQRTVFVGWCNTGTQVQAPDRNQTALYITEWDPVVGLSSKYHYYIPRNVKWGGSYTWPIHGFTFENALYLVAGLDPGTPIVKVTGKYLDNQNEPYENVGANWQLTQQAGIAPRICALYSGTLYLAGFEGKDASTVWNTDPLSETLPGVTAGIRQLSPHNFPVGEADDPIEAMVAVPIWGGSSPVEPYLLVLKSRSVWVMKGTPSQKEDAIIPGDTRITPLMQNEGCISANTVALTPFGVVWCSGKNVWLLPPSGAPRAIGEKIAPHLRTLPQTRTAAWNAIYDHVNRRYMLSVPNPGNMTWGEQVLQQSEHWWADMRGEPENPEWWGPMDIPTCGMFFSEKAGNVLVGVVPFGLLQDPWIGSVFGGAQLPNGWSNGGDMTHVTPGTGGWQFGDPTYKTFTLDNRSHDFKDMGQSVYSTQWDARFKEFDFGDPFLLKIWESIEIEAEMQPSWTQLTSVNAAPYLVQFVTGNAVMTQMKVSANEGYFNIQQDSGGLRLDTAAVFGSGGFGGGTVGGGGGGGVSAAYPDVSRLVARTFEPRLISQLVNDDEDPANTIRAHWKLATMGLVFRPVGRRPTSKGQVDS